MACPTGPLPEIEKIMQKHRPTLEEVKWGSVVTTIPDHTNAHSCRNNRLLVFILWVFIVAVLVALIMGMGGRRTISSSCNGAPTKDAPRHGGPGAAPVLELTASGTDNVPQLREAVKQGMVLMLIHASWCPHCVKVGVPEFREAAKMAKGPVQFLMLEHKAVPDNGIADLVRGYKPCEGFPCYVLIEEGKVVRSETGAKKRGQVAHMISTKPQGCKVAKVSEDQCMQMLKDLSPGDKRNIFMLFWHVQHDPAILDNFTSAAAAQAPNSSLFLQVPVQQLGKEGSIHQVCGVQTLPHLCHWHATCDTIRLMGDMAVLSNRAAMQQWVDNQVNSNQC